MHRFTQASLSLEIHDIRHLQADQEFCEVTGCFDLT